MLNKDNIGIILSTYLCINLLEKSAFKLKLINETKRTYHFKVGDIKISIPKKSLREYYEKYK